MKEKGVTLVALILTIIIIFILTATLIYTGEKIINSAKLQTLNTNMLLIQAKVKVYSERDSFAGGAGLELKGKRIGTEGAQAYSTIVADLVSAGVIASTEPYYIWDKEVLKEIGLVKIDADENSIYLVDFETEEVIFSDGYRHTDGEIYYKLSETKNLSVNE